MNALEHVRVQLWLNVTHRTRLSVTFAINHVDNTVVLHCLNIGNVSDGDSLASHTATNQEYIGRVQTLAWCFHFCFHNDFVLSTSRLTQRYFKPWKQVARNHHTAISSTQQVSRHDEGSIRPPLIVAYRPLSFPVKCGWIYVAEHLILLPSLGMYMELLLKLHPTCYRIECHSKERSACMVFTHLIGFFSWSPTITTIN